MGPMKFVPSEFLFGSFGAPVGILATHLNRNIDHWVVVEPIPLKNMLVKNGSFPQVGVKIKNV